MEPDFSSLYHQSSKDHSKGHPPINPDPALWPEAWKTVSYKAYPRFPKIILPPTTGSADLFRIIERRTTRHGFNPETALGLEEIARLLRYSCGTTGVASDGTSMRRAQPSGGARFPIEVYALVLRGEDGLKPGLYHYNVKHHALEVLWDKQFSDEEVKKLFVYEWTKEAGVIFFMTAVFRRNQMKYGERGYRYILIEAGHIGQNMYLVSEALGLKCCALGGTRDEAVEKLLDIDGVYESVVYAVAVGH